MPSRTVSKAITAVRALLVAAGVAVAALTVLKLATMPPPPPDSDGFAHGMAALVGGLVIAVSLGVAAVSVVLPSLLGRADPLGFNRWQRRVLQAAGLLVVGGLVVSLAYGLLTDLLLAGVLWFGLVVVAILGVAVTLAWRLGEVIVARLSGATAGPTE